MIGVLAKVLAPLIGHSDDHDWVCIFAEKRLALIDGEIASGSLMMRVVKGQPQYRNMTAAEQIDHLSAEIATVLR